MIYYRVPPIKRVRLVGEGVVSNHLRHKRPPLFSGESHPNGIDPHFHYRCTCRWQPEPLTKIGALLHNLIGGSQQMPPRPQPATPTNRLGFQEPKSKNLLNFHSPNPPGRTQTDAPNANGKNTSSALILLSQIPQKLQKLVGE